MSGVNRVPRRRRPKSEGGDEQRGLKGDVHKMLTRMAAEGAPIRFRKNWGGRLTGSGEPDYTGCARGRYWALELKHPGLDEVAGSTPSPAQGVILAQIRRAGGVTCVTNRIEVAQEFILGLLRGV